MDEVIKIFEEFSESIYDVLETNSKISGDYKRINQLLFCHLINNFSTFIEGLNKNILPLNKDKVDFYFLQTKKESNNITIKDLFEIEKTSFKKWKEDIAVNYYLSVTNKLPSYEKVKSLLDLLGIKPEKYFVCLSGGGEQLGYQSGFIRPIENQYRRKRNPKGTRKKSLNHDTNSDKLLGFIDVFYEKRNGVTHNQGRYKDIDKLNNSWSLKIKKDSILIKKTSLHSIIRFLCSFSNILLSELYNKGHIYDYKDLEGKFIVLSELKVGKKIGYGELDKYSARLNILLEKHKGKSYSSKEYQVLFNISSTTCSRDIQKFKKNENFLIKQSGKGSAYTIYINK